MNGDFSRLTFQPRKHYSGVLMQQGRVQLDADWNELVQIFQHRIEQQTIDTIGACGVPKSPAGQPAPFTVTADSNGTLHLRPGRIYLDGLLCELEPDATPSLPTVDLTGLTGSKSVLVYLDAWQRHVSAIEDGSLRESALGGADTTTRLQMAWMVRLNLNPTPDRNCDAVTDLPSPSNGMLTTHQSAPTSTTPCVVGSKGGYVGLENRLYRVEIHQADTTAQPATFKWSRDNNSIGLPISSFPASDSVAVSQLGRDDVTRFLNHWVEVLGDESEFQQGAGTLAQVIQINQLTKTLKLDRDISSHQAETNPRIRRWDMPFVGTASGGSPPQGAIAITPGPAQTLLDPSVYVSFDVPAATNAPHFQAADYWIFTARTAEGMLEPLTKALPQGVRHHYCKLAWVTWTKTVDTVLVGVQPCSHPFPPLTDLPPPGGGCCIQLAAGPLLGQRLQSALDTVGVQGGGCVCLPSGIQVLDAPIVVRAARTTICGCDGTSRLVYLPPATVTDPAITIINADRAMLKDFGLFALGADAVVSVQASAEVCLENCRLVNLPAGASPSPCVLTNDAVPNLAIRSCDLVGGCGLLALSDAGRQANAVPGMTNMTVEGCRIRTRLLGAYVEVPYNFVFDQNDVAGFVSTDWTALIPSGSPGLTQSNIPNIESIIDDRLHAARGAGSYEGYFLPAGLFLLFPTLCRISHSQIRAGIGILAVGAQTIDITSNQLFGLVGISLVFSLFGRIQANQINTALYGCLATGWATWYWQIAGNLITSRDGVVIGPALTAGQLILEAFTAMASGFTAFLTGRDAFTLKGTVFEPGPTAWHGFLQPDERYRASQRQSAPCRWRGDQRREPRSRRI
jgi:hypothetical protein